MRRWLSVPLALLVLALAGRLTAQQLLFPNKSDSVRLAVIGDSGTGGRAQYRVAEQLASYYRLFPFEFVLLLGDNLYGREQPSSFRKKFEAPYKPLLDARVKFYAVLGNHDDPSQRFYELFNMKGERYYTFKKGGVRFFALDSNYMDRKQLDWVEKELADSKEKWKICFFHHPLYSSGRRHGSAVALRGVLEPLFVKHGVSAVLAGHEHFYERLKPQKGIYYFTSGSAAKLRKHNLRTSSELTAQGFDTGYTFMLMEISDEELHFQAISDQGVTIDSGILLRPQRQEEQKAAAASSR